MALSEGAGRRATQRLFDKGWPRKSIFGQVVWFCSWAAVTVIGLFLHPDRDHHGTHTQLGLPPCPSILVFHRPCPGCGLTTSWTALLHGDLNASIHAHALGPFLYVAFTITALLCIYGYFNGLRLRSDSKSANFGLVVTFIGLIGYGGVRFATTTYPSLWDVFLTSGAGEHSRQSASVPKEDPPLQFSGVGQRQ